MSIRNKTKYPVFESKVDLQMKVGHFEIRTICSQEELKQAFLLRYQVFQVEMMGFDNEQGEDFDEFDVGADHLAIFDTKTSQMIATCRLNCSLFSNRFYSAQEFQCIQLLSLPKVKLEVGRVCVRKDFRKGIIIMLLWRAIAEYMIKTETTLLFGCGSVMTQDPKEAMIVYQYLQDEGRIYDSIGISPTEKYRSIEFDGLLQDRPPRKLNSEERIIAQSLLPSLCKSYFDIGCYVPGPPAFDREFKCIDFLTILEVDQLDPKVRQKIFGEAIYGSSCR